MDSANMDGAGTAPMPRVGGMPLVGALPGVLFGQFRFLEQAVARVGKIFEVDLGPARVVVVADVRAAEDVLIHSADRYDKGGDFWDGLREAMGVGLPMSEGALWRRQRTLMQPGFQRRLVEGYRDAIADVVTHAVEGLGPGGAVDMTQWCDELFAELTVRILLGGSGHDRPRTHRIRRAMVSLTDRLMTGLVTRRLPRWLPVPGRHRLEHIRRALGDEVMALISERRRSSRRSHDLLSMLIEATDESGMMSDEQLRDEAITLYVAGYETTGTAFAWIVWLLASHPHTCAELQAELDGNPREAPLLRACVQEGLRLYPPAPLMQRRAAVDGALGGFAVRADSLVMVSPWLIHRDPELWPRPLAFEPRRFLDQDASRRPRLAWIPFGAGQRLCIGKALALIELEQAVRVLLQRFEPRLIPGTRAPTPRLSSTLRPRRRIVLDLRPR